MAIVDEALTGATGEPADAATTVVAGASARRRTHTKLRLAFGFSLGLLLVLGVTAGGLYAWDQQYEGRILPGVNAGGVDLGGMDRDQATVALNGAYRNVSDGQVVVRTEAGNVAVPFAAFGRHVDVDRMVDAAMGAGRDGTTAERALGEVRLAMTGHTIAPTLVQDEGALSSQIARGLSALELAPVNAQVVKSGDTTYTLPARPGRSFDVAAAAAAATALVRDLAAPAELTVDARASVLEPTVTDTEVETARAAADAMDARLVVVFRDQKWKLKSKKIRRWIDFTTAADGSIQPTVDLKAIAKALKPVAKGVKRAPVNAVIFRSNGRVVGVAAAQDGLRLDVPATATAIAQALTARGQGVAPAPVKVEVDRVPARVTTEEALEKGPLMQRLGSWKTWFPIGESNYFGANIWQPARIIDGTVLRPGQRFEWWSAIGPVTTSRGFGPGGYIAGNHTDPTGAFGGGMCSSSTTLFNAAMRAGLQMGARSNHKYYIPRYPLGLDATVSKTAGGGGQTMSFTNDMKRPIVIRSFRYTAGGLGWVRYEIWGFPDGRTVSLSKPSVANVVRATTSTVYVDSLPRGVRKQVEYPSNQMDVSVTRVVRNRAGRVIHSDTWRSHYVLWNGLIQIGR